MTPIKLRAYQRRAIASMLPTDCGGVFTTAAYRYAFEDILREDMKQYGALQPLPAEHIVKQLSAIESVVRLGQDSWYCTDSRA